MKRSILILVVGVAALTIPVSLMAQKVVKESIRSLEKDRAYYLFVPDGLKTEKEAPLIVMLHGSGRDGLSLVDKWKDLAKTEGIILAGPNSQRSGDWRIPEDGPDAIYDLIEALKAKYPIDPRRVYLFGHSAGAVVALYMALLESEYFAAASVHAGAMQANDGPFIQRSKRRIPISIFVGTNDQFFPVSTVRATRDLLNTHGLNAQLNEIKGHTHDYYSRSNEINKAAWTFMKDIKLSQEPKYERYKWDK